MDQQIGKQMTDKTESDKFVTKLRKMEIASALVQCAINNKIQRLSDFTVLEEACVFLTAVFKEKDESST